jgi:hypothetical protein
MGRAKVDSTLNVDTQVIDGAMRSAVDKAGSQLFIIRKRARSYLVVRIAEQPALARFT